MARYLHGDRIGKLATLALSCNAVIFDPTRRRILLTRRTDNGQWRLPGGMLDAGESVAEACAREVREETGLRVRIGRLIGVYSNPHRITEYADGNRYHFVSLSFEAEPTGGELSISEETTDYGYFSPAEIEGMRVIAPHRERIADAFAKQNIPFVR